MTDGGLRKAYLELLMQQLTTCRYPSPTMMDRVEQAVGSREQAEGYVRCLMDNVQGSRFPSPQFLDRITGLIDALEPR